MFLIVISSNLLGLILQGFELTLPKIRPSFNAANSSCSAINDHIPMDGVTSRLSWKMLEIEPDEENELKEHLWLLHFRKLQKVVKQFSASVSQLHNRSHEGENSMHTIACQCIYRWLSQRTEAIKEMFLVQSNGQCKSNRESRK